MMGHGGAMPTSAQARPYGAQWPVGLVPARCHGRTSSPLSRASAERQCREDTSLAASASRVTAQLVHAGAPRLPCGDEGYRVIEQTGEQEG